MTHNVFGGTLNLAQSTAQSIHKCVDYFKYLLQFVFMSLISALICHMKFDTFVYQ